MGGRGGLPRGLRMTLGARHGGLRLPGCLQARRESLRGRVFLGQAQSTSRRLLGNPHGTPSSCKWTMACCGEGDPAGPGTKGAGDPLTRREAGRAGP